MSSAQLQPPSTARAVSHPVTPSQLAWLDSQLREWQVEGMVDESAAAAIRGRYVAVRRVTLVRVVLSLGAAFVAVGLIWLVAANLDRFAPLARFILVAAIWVVLTVVAEVLAARRERAGDIASPVVSAARFLAAASFAAVVFQAAQSVQVPAYEASLLGYWALGALVYAYVVRDLAPLILAVAGLAVWYIWQVTASTQGPFGFAVAALVGAVVATVVAVAHRTRWWPEFAIPWRESAAVVALIGMFVAAIPRGTDQEAAWSLALVVGTALALVLAVAAARLGGRWDRAEVGLVVAALLLGGWC